MGPDFWLMHRTLSIYDACKKWGQRNERTNGRTESGILGVGWGLYIPLHSWYIAYSPSWSPNSTYLYLDVSLLSWWWEPLSHGSRREPNPPKKAKKLLLPIFPKCFEKFENVGSKNGPLGPKNYSIFGCFWPFLCFWPVFVVFLSYLGVSTYFLVRRHHR